MASASVSLRRAALYLVALLLVAAGVIYGRRMEISTQVVRPATAPQSESEPVITPNAQKAPVVKTVDIAASAPAASDASDASASYAVNLPISAGADISQLRLRELMLPVQGVAAVQLTDTYTQARAAGVPHEALDIMAARGTPVFAVEDGKVAKLFLSKPGGITLYQFDPAGEYAYYYAHLDRYADGLAEGASLRKGQVIGYVGSTGNASPDAPHLHFALFKLGPERQWWRGTPLNPYLVWRDQRP